MIDAVRPQVACGSYPAKRKLGDTVEVSADIFTHGTELLAAELQYKVKGTGKWERIQMRQGQNDRWSASFPAENNATYEFTIEAWTDKYSTWLENLKKWHQAGEDTSQDVKTGIRMIKGMASSAGREKQKILALAAGMEAASSDEAVRIASDPSTVRLATSYQKKDRAKFGKTLEVVVDRRIAGFASWYELFPRSQSRTPGKHGTFTDCAARVDDIAAMGFDVLYLTPIHPIGTTARRGKNGAPKAEAGEPGSPWAIGSADGGHKAIHHELGTMEDFKKLLDRAKRKGLEVALDIAFQCSPDHPYVSEHPEWFFHRSDGSIRYAENPPKKYYDIYPLDFENTDWKNLWEELKSIFLYWIEAGVRIFRVDNPHTKPFTFWEWVISEIRKEHPDVIFFSEAFTRPKVMYELSMVGFSQSYTYFTWKNFNWELEQYFTEVFGGEVSDFFRPNLFANTPDILPFVLQTGGRPAFMMRALLAATLSPLWGIYSGYELCENEALQGREEYLNSEKYEIRQRDWNRAGNIRDFIAKLNEIRKKSKPFQEFGNLQFHPVGNPNMLLYTRSAAGDGKAVMVVVNINPFTPQDAVIKVPLEVMGVAADQDYRVRDLLTGEQFSWHGEYNYVRLVPGERAGHVFSVEV